MWKDDNTPPHPTLHHPTRTSLFCARVTDRPHSGAHVNIPPHPTPPPPHPTPDAHVDEYECDFAGGWPLVSCVSAQVSEIASAQVSACPEYICSFYKATNVAGFALCFGGNFWSPH